MKRAQCLSLLQLFSIPYDSWRKPADAFFDEIERKLARIVLRNTPSGTRIVRASQSSWVYVQHIDFNGVTWEMYEIFRKFPDGYEDKRGHGFISETPVPGEPGMTAALRALAEEAGYTAPERWRLWPMEFDLATRTGALLYDEHESVAYEGIITVVSVERYIYQANHEEFNEGKPYDSTDEYGVTTRVGWRRTKR